MFSELSLLHIHTLARGEINNDDDDDDDDEGDDNNDNTVPVFYKIHY